MDEALASAADVDELTIRRGAVIFIQGWGGLEVFGTQAVTRLEGQLHALDMKVKYLKPHALIGVIAIRHVAGDLRQAGLLRPRDMPTLLERLNAPTPPQPLSLSQGRPIGVHRPLGARDAGYTEGERAWVESVGGDVATWCDRREEPVVAEISRFKIYKRRAGRASR